MRNKDSNVDDSIFSIDNPIEGISDSLRDENTWNAGDASVYSERAPWNDLPWGIRPIGGEPGCCSGGGSGSIIEESEIVL
ncbi:hypothetical protein [Treponema pedis]|uniref:hypothetical protein n=1 Tax=Treponema pedis TaxID=409322 RepID=UPI000466557C|nr:hypothetical protein [Treponema pedis]